MTILPKIPSQLLRIAHADFSKIREDPSFTIQMGLWLFYHEISKSAKCEACLAGAVMAKTLDCNPVKKQIFPDEFIGNEDQLKAIDYLRCNCTQAAFYRLGIDDPPSLDAPLIPDYEASPSGFMTSLLALADHLETCGH